jgi:hypothetical protein
LKYLILFIFFVGCTTTRFRDYNPEKFDITISDNDYLLKIEEKDLNKKYLIIQKQQEEFLRKDFKEKP